MATYNLINSVKGGCGKTTFSIYLARYLRKSLLIDMDLLGTSMQVLVYGNDNSSRNTAYTNDVFQKIENNRKKFVDKIDLNNGECINVIFSTMDNTEKDKFKGGKHSGYTPVVKHSMFRQGLKELLKHHKTLDGERIEHFVFDMPPNSDGFSDAAMECIFNPRYSYLAENDRKNLFMMIGADWGQTIAAIYELKTLLLREDGNEPDRIFVVINCNLGNYFEVSDYNSRKHEIEKALNTWHLKEELKNKIIFLKMKHNEYYTKLGIAGKGLKEATMSEINNAFNAIIVAYAEFGKDFDDIATDPSRYQLLKEMISGEWNAKNDEA